MNLKRYKNPPIKEAVLTVGYKKGDKFSLEQALAIDKIFSPEFPLRKDIVVFESNLKIGNGAEAELSQNKQSLKGYSFWSEDNTKVYQITAESFSYNILKPYSNRFDFVSKAKEIWESLDKEIEIDQVSSVSLRYINRILIPIPFKDFDDYINGTPKIPKCLPNSLSAFFNQIQVPVSENILATISTTIEPDTNDHLPFILDITVTKFGRPALNKNEFWDEMEEMLNLKNDIFEDSITDETRKLFD